MNPPAANPPLGPEIKRVLIVEDEWLIADELEAMLRRLNFEIMGPVPRSDSALALLAKEAPDAAILDVSLDRHFSFPVADMLTNAKIPFLFLSGYTVKDLPPRYRSAPLLQKPVMLEVLRAKMAALLTSRH